MNFLFLANIIIVIWTKGRWASQEKRVVAPHAFSPQKPYYIMRERERERERERLFKTLERKFIEIKF